MNTFYYICYMKKPAPKKQPAPTPVRFPPELKKKLVELADKENRPLSNMIITIVKDFFDKK